MLVIKEKKTVYLDQEIHTNLKMASAILKKTESDIINELLKKELSQGQIEKLWEEKKRQVSLD